MTAHGKFFLRGDQKFFIKAVRLDGPIIATNFDDKLRTLSRVEELHRDHITALVLTAEQAEAALELAAMGGLYVLVELSLDPDSLWSRSSLRAAESWIESNVRSLGGRAGLLGFLIDCPVPQDALRAHGLRAARRALRRLLNLIREPGFAAGIHHRIETRSLALDDEDFVYTDAVGLSPLELRDYLVSIHNLADSRPVIIEFNGANPSLDELAATAFGMGAAGVVAPAALIPPPDQALAVTAHPADSKPFLALNGDCPPVPAETPMVSVVICAYNAERTMRACLEALARLDYSNYEVIVVDDGSRDRTAEISAGFPQFRLIRQLNKGLSAARNVGLHAARGEIVAYTDSDCVVDPHWLTFMAGTMIERGFDSCGGPNYAPHEDGQFEACCAASPGAPCHVLTAEDRAEHLAGCNMMFRRRVLLDVGGFDPQFTTAGDDVDICWRILDAGYSVGFCPSAFVWHFRRNTIRAYYGQQRGYGRAEAMLYFKYPERFNLLGQIRWRGRIPGLSRMIPGGEHHRIWWNAPAGYAQALDTPIKSMLAFLPQTFEWNFFAGVMVIVSMLRGFTILPALAMFLAGPLWALYYARRAPLERCHRRLSSRLLIGLLAYSGPMQRTIARYQTRLKIVANTGIANATRQRPLINLIGRSVVLSYWNDSYTTREIILYSLTRLCNRLHYPVMMEAGWRDYDLEVRRDLWTRIEFRTADEEHGGMRLINRIAGRIRLTLASKLALLTGIASTIVCAIYRDPHLMLVTAALTSAGMVCLIGEALEAGRFAYRAIETCAGELSLTPIGTPTRAARRAALVQDKQSLSASPELVAGQGRLDRFSPE
ncbi:MAG: glycosyltransferase [Candidatus Binataceae bacterium]|nr:glycosyltransferase [Candidatus Binataceae bacterium]